MVQTSTEMLPLLRNENFQSAVFGAASGLLAMGLTFLLPSGWITGVMLIGLSFLLFALYFVLLARTHEEVEALSAIRQRQKHIVAAGVILFVAAAGTSAYGAYRLKRQSEGLLDAIRQGEQIKQSALNSSVATLADRNKWVASTLHLLPDHGLDMCAVSFEFPQEGLTLFHAGIPMESSKIWNDVNVRTEALHECLKEPK